MTRRGLRLASVVPLLMVCVVVLVLTAKEGAGLVTRPWCWDCELHDWGGNIGWGAICGGAYFGYVGCTQSDPLHCWVQYPMCQVQS
jgi:hypothetical protein